LNLLWMLRWRSIYNDFNNFKYLLENILKNIKTDFVMFVPDDQIFYKETYIPNKVFDLILENKYQTYYRFFTGDHFAGKYSLRMTFSHFRHIHCAFLVTYLTIAGSVPRNLP
jgi:hypothetical protein